MLLERILSELFRAEDTLDYPCNASLAFIMTALIDTGRYDLISISAFPLEHEYLVDMGEDVASDQTFGLIEYCRSANKVTVTYTWGPMLTPFILTESANPGPPKECVVTSETPALPN